MTAPVRTSHLADHLPDRPRARIDLGAMLADPARRLALSNAFALPDVEPRTTTVDPELAEAMADLRHAVEQSARVLYARTFALRYGHKRALPKLQRLGVHWQVETECALERVESIVCAGRGNR